MSAASRLLKASIYFALCGVMFFTVACSKKDSSPAHLRIPLGSEPTSLDPHVADTGASVLLLRQIVSTLLDYDENYVLKPYDAQSFKWVQSGRVFYVKLKPDLKWSDGKPLQACQYRNGILRALDPKVSSHLADLLFDIKGAQQRKAGLTSADDVGIRCDNLKGELFFESVRSYSTKLMHALAFIVSAPIREDLLAKHDGEWLLPHDNKVGVGSGAYVLEEWAHDRRVVLQARPQDSTLPLEKKSSISKVVLPLIKDATTALSMYQSGELDFLDEIPTAQLKKYITHKERFTAPYFTTYMVGFSFRQNPALRDPRLRQALALTAHQEEVPALLAGLGLKARGWVPPDLIQAEADNMNRIAFDAKRARKLLQEAGHSDPKKLAPLKLFYNSGERHQILMERLAYNWKTELGLNVELNPIEWKVLVSQLKVQPPDMFRYAWSAAYPDALFFLELFLSKGLNNYGDWSNATYDQLVRELQSVPLHERDSSYWKKVSQAEDILVQEDPAIIPIYHYLKNGLLSSRIEGLKINGQGFFYFKDLKIKARP